MAERFDNLLDNKVNNNNSTPFQREVELLRDGLSTGVTDRLEHMASNLGETATNLGICAGIGAGLNIASRAGGRWGTAAKFGTGILLVAGVGDVARRAVPTLAAMGDTWSSGANLEANKETVAKYAGSALVDYPVMMAAGYGGFKLGGLAPVRTTVFEFADMSGLKNMKDTLSPGSKALLDNSLPINARTRALLDSVKDLPPAQRVDAAKALGAKPFEPIKLNDPAALGNPTPKFDAAKLAEIAKAKPSVLAKDLLGPEMPVPSAKPVDLVGGKLGKIELPGMKPIEVTANKTEPFGFEKNIRDYASSMRLREPFSSSLKFETISSIRHTFIPPIIPVDLLDRTEERLIQVGKIGAAAEAGAIGGAAMEGVLKGLKLQPKAEQPKLEVAPAPREVELKQAVIERLELPKLEFKELPQAFIQQHRMMDHIEERFPKRAEK